MMKQITLNGIKSVLDDYYSKFIGGDKSVRNILFLGYFCIGKNGVIQDWFKDKDIRPIYFQPHLPPLSRINEDGTLSKGGNTYTFADNDFDFLSDKNSAIYVKRINHACNEGFVNEFGKILKTGKYTTCFGREYDLTDIFGVIATGYTDETGSVCEEFKPLEEFFDIYHVVPEKQEYTDYFNKLYDLKQCNHKKRIERCSNEQKLAERILQYEGFEMRFADCREKQKEHGKKRAFTPRDLISLIKFSGGNPNRAIKLLREQYIDEIVNRILPALEED